MNSPEWIRKTALDDAFVLMQEDTVSDQVSSTFFGDVREKISRDQLEKLIVAKPKKRSGTSLATAVSSIFGGLIYPGRVTLFKPFFENFNIAIGPGETGNSLGLSMRQMRTIVVLHELTHVTRRYVDIFQFVGMHYFDEAIYDKYTINKRLYDVCRDKKEFLDQSDISN